MACRHSFAVLGVLVAVFGLGTPLSAADLALIKARETTVEWTRKNKSALIEVFSTVPEEFRREIIEVVQGLELSRDRMLIFLDRIEEGLIPADEGVKRVKAIATTAAQKEREFLQALMKRVPAPVVPRVEEVLQVSANSWQEILLALQVPKQAEEQELPPQPGFDIMISPRPFDAPPSGQ